MNASSSNGAGSGSGSVAVTLDPLIELAKFESLELDGAEVKAIGAALGYDGIGAGLGAGAVCCG